MGNYTNFNANIICLFSNQVKHFRHIQKSKPRFTEIKRQYTWGAETVGNMYIENKKNSHLKSNQCSALDTTGDSPGPWRGEEKHKTRNVTLIAATGMYLQYFMCLGWIHMPFRGPVSSYGHYASDWTKICYKSIRTADEAVSVSTNISYWNSDSRIFFFSSFMKTSSGARAWINQSAPLSAKDRTSSERKLMSEVVYRCSPAWLVLHIKLTALCSDCFLRVDQEALLPGLLLYCPVTFTGCVTPRVHFRLSFTSSR